MSGASGNGGAGRQPEYQEEWDARVNATVREAVTRLRGGGEPHPVVLLDEQNAAHAVGLAQARDGLDAKAGGGVGTLLLAAGLTDPEAFRSVVFSPGRVELRVLRFEAGRVRGLGVYTLSFAPAGTGNASPFAAG
jgi:hypothetical protein